MNQLLLIIPFQISSVYHLQFKSNLWTFLSVLLGFLFCCYNSCNYLSSVIDRSIILHTSSFFFFAFFLALCTHWSGSTAMSIRWPRLLTPTHLSQIIRKQKNPLASLQIFKEANNKYPNYHHNGPVYATMIGILGSSGRITEMKEVIDQMKEDSCECKDSVFATTINTYARAGFLNEAISLFKNIPKFNCVNWTESFNTLLQIMVKESMLESAHSLFLESSYGWEVKSRVRSLNLLMDVLCQHNRSDLALHVFQEMSYQGCHPDRDSYQILMRGLCKDRRLNEAIHLLYSMFWSLQSLP